tara:strand:+ start:122 stop:325 length:204 start_codon:yes stop_codon:yes gene_type:complete
MIIVSSEIKEALGIGRFIDNRAVPNKIAKNGIKSTKTLDEKLPPYHQFHQDDNIYTRMIKKKDNAIV